MGGVSWRCMSSSSFSKGWGVWWEGWVVALGKLGVVGVVGWRMVGTCMDRKGHVGCCGEGMVGGICRVRGRGRGSRWRLWRAFQRKMGPRCGGG